MQCYKQIISEFCLDIAQCNTQMCRKIEEILSNVDDSLEKYVEGGCVGNY